MGKDKGKANENSFRALADESRGASNAAIATAAQPDEFEARRRKRLLALDQWESGEMGPQDVRNMPDGGVNMALFNDALASHDEGRQGIGVHSMSGANPNYVAKLDQENQLRRRVAASGALEQNVHDTLDAKNAEMYGWANVGNQRNMQVAGMREGRYEGDQNRYTQYLMRPKQPNFFKQMALTLAGGVNTAVKMGAGGV